jgi:glyoxylate/hydroxypyruvate reductase A
MPLYARQQRDKVWRPWDPPLARDRTVGILGLGQIGAACAATIAGLGFKVRGWSRSPKTLAGVETMSGPLAPFLAGCHVLVNVLPLTPETEGILNRETFSHLDQAYLVNVGRGGHLIEEDLIPALDAGRLAGATLDVFRTEPLPAEHPFWTDPRIVVVPHASAVTHPGSAGARIVANVRAAVAGRPMQGVVDRNQGY